MSDREQELRALAADPSERDDVVDAWTAKSFTDRLFVLELASGTPLSTELLELLSQHDLRGYNEVHDVGVENVAFAGELDGEDRYQFVDVGHRGELQSYVVE
jgi:hypothetical protein